MMRRISGLRPSYAGVIATLALVLALGMGGAYAAGEIGSKQISPSAVKSKHVKDGAVKAHDLATGAVTGRAIAADAVDGLKVANGTITSSDLSSSSVGADELVPDSVTKIAIGPDSVGDSELALTVRTNQVNVPNNTTDNITAECLASEVALAGGGGFAGVPNGTSLATTKAANGGWYVEGRNSSGSVATLGVQAFCLGQ